jgi:chromosome segregation ATPase
MNGPKPAHSTSDAMTAGRRADSARRRQRVLTAIADTLTAGEELTVNAIARKAAVDRSFRYRHRDLLAQIHASQTQPPTNSATRPSVSRASLQADLLAAQHRTTRQAAHIRQLERHLSQALGEKAWQESGLGAPTDIDQLQQQITHLEQKIVDLRLQIEERDQDLHAVRAANRELITQLNTRPRNR